MLIGSVTDVNRTRTFMKHFIILLISNLFMQLGEAGIWLFEGVPQNFTVIKVSAFGMFAKGYLKKPVAAAEIKRVLDEMVTDWSLEKTEEPCDIRVQTFGYFEVFADGKPVIFEREKSKELLAYLVDRHGAAVTTEQIAALLWEDIPYDRKLKNRVTATIAALKNSLKAAGIEDILIKTWNHLSLDISKIKCDAYDYEKWDAVAVNAFHGAYMLNDSWAEFTTGRYSQMK